MDIPLLPATLSPVGYRIVEVPVKAGLSRPLAALTSTARSRTARHPPVRPGSHSARVALRPFAASGRGVHRTKARTYAWVAVALLILVADR